MRTDLGRFRTPTAGAKLTVGGVSFVLVIVMFAHTGR